MYIGVVIVVGAAVFSVHLLFFSFFAFLKKNKAYQVIRGRG